MKNYLNKRKRVGEGIEKEDSEKKKKEQVKNFFSWHDYFIFND